MDNQEQITDNQDQLIHLETSADLVQDQELDTHQQLEELLLDHHMEHLELVILKVQPTELHPVLEVRDEESTRK